jgi:hypothetical protein
MNKNQARNVEKHEKKVELDTDGYLESDLKHKLIERLFYFINQLESETQLDNQTKILNNIEKLVDIIAKLGGII